MKERAKELRTTAKRAGSKDKDAKAAADQLAKIAELPEADRVLAERVQAIVTAAAPELKPKLWYGMPGYAKDGKVLVFFQAAEKFKTRYSTLGFNDVATLDDGAVWPVAYAITALTEADEARITELVRRAAG
jgi:uncharacterized protein YdhG (YjbR/CyaY superfamily)